MTVSSRYSLFPLSDSALLIEFGNEIDDTVSDAVMNAYHLLRQQAFDGIVDIIPAYSSIAVMYDVSLLHMLAMDQSVFDFVSTFVNRVLKNNTEFERPAQRLLRIPVCYAETFAPDITMMAKEKGISKQEIIERHTTVCYRVCMNGFLPGFAYMGTVDDVIATPRKKEPRLEVHAGSVGIAGSQTGIYPFNSPGGWQIIGRTPLRIFNKGNQQVPAYFTPGDAVLFYSITEDEFENYKGRHL
jgi:inhibitor of KinA